MPQNSNFRLPRCHRFRPKSDLTVMAPNHSGDTLGSIVGPMGFHLVQKMGENRKKLPCPKIRIFDYPRSSILAKIRPYGYGAKSRWGPPSVHLGANGSKKWVKTVKDYHAPKSDLMVMALIHGGGPLGSILGPMGSHWVQNNGWKPLKKYHAPKFEFSTTPRSSISVKIRPYCYGANSWWGPLGSILGPMGSHCVQNMGQNREKLPCPKIRIFDYPAVIDFGQNPTLQLWRQITVGTP